MDCRIAKRPDPVILLRSVAYDLATAKALFDYVLDRIGIKPYSAIRKTLTRVISRYHRQRLQRLVRVAEDDTDSTAFVSAELEL